jgi:hypothetical protein
MRPVFAILCVLFAGCAKPAASRPAASCPAPAPVSVANEAPPPTEPAPAEPAAIAPEVALAEARSRFANAKVSEPYEVPAHAAELAAAGLDETRAALLVRSAVAECLATELRCDGLSVLPESKEQEAAAHTVRLLLEQLGAVGHDATLPLLVRLDSRGVYGASDALEQVLERRAAAARTACEPPTAAELQAQKAALADFAVLEHDGTRWVGRAPSADESEDLAYLFVAVSDESAPVGQAPERGPPVFGKRAAPNAEREALILEMAAARMRGNSSAHALVARRYLTTLGYPGPLRGDEESNVMWGGPKYAYVMRELAVSTEILGELGEAADLYRRANPGGGGCGTTVESRRADQSRGLIRVVEGSQGCRPVVAERLYASSRGRRNEWYGPKRLADAGFDLARLYRGALLTRGRDAEPSELRGALAAIPGTFGAAALARYVSRGAEEWDARVRGLEGLADTAGKRAVPILIARAKTGPVASRTRALNALGELAAHTGSDPCKPGLRGWFHSHHGSRDEREIRALNATCDTRFSSAELADTARRISALSSDKDPSVREEVARALGQIASAASVPTLTALLSDPFKLEGSTVCSTTGNGPERCRPNWPVREQARTALDRIADVRKHERQLGP